MSYRLKLFFLRQPAGSYIWRYWQAWRGRIVGSYSDLPEYVRQYSAGASFTDVGCMWGVNGAYAFMAEEAGATTIKGIDTFGPTPEFEQERKKRQSKVEFVLGDITEEITLEKTGIADTVLCAGVLYHHPNPFEMLVALRQICRQTLILRTFAIPENKAIRNSAVLFPYLSDDQRDLWNLERQGLAKQLGIGNAFRPEDGYGNYFWGMTPSCIRSLLRLAGFTVRRQAAEPFAQTFVCTPCNEAFANHLPDEAEAQRLASEISRKDIAKPA